VRGYYESEVLADYGAALTLEVAHPLPGGSWFGNGLESFAFFDGGASGLHDALPEQPDQFELASVGLGVRGALRELQFETLWAKALATGVQTGQWDDRIMFELRYGM
jgi:hemolysin activation/secretion protein